MKISRKIRNLARILILINTKVFSKTDITTQFYYRFLNRIQILTNNQNLKFALRMNPDNLIHILEYLGENKSQLNQDLYVASQFNLFNQKFEGYFIEVGGANGIDLSNTYLLEKVFGWKGIIVEPAKIWQEMLLKNRPNIIIDKHIVWNESNRKLDFFETQTAELSTIGKLSSGDENRLLREAHRRYKISTITLTDLLDKYHAPKHIEYLSIDTEGSELDILNAVDFKKYTFDIITVEHNYTSAREKIYSLLTKHGYKREFQDISRFDDWYISSKFKQQT
jgi:FkbM family methyltransferase